MSNKNRVLVPSQLSHNVEEFYYSLGLDLLYKYYNMSLDKATENIVNKLTKYNLISGDVKKSEISVDAKIDTFLSRITNENMILETYDVVNNHTIYPLDSMLNSYGDISGADKVRILISICCNLFENYVITKPFITKLMEVLTDRNKPLYFQPGQIWRVVEKYEMLGGERTRMVRECMEHELFIIQNYFHSEEVKFENEVNEMVAEVFYNAIYLYKNGLDIERIHDINSGYSLDNKFYNGCKVTNWYSFKIKNLPKFEECLRKVTDMLHIRYYHFPVLYSIVTSILFKEKFIRFLIFKGVTADRSVVIYESFMNLICKDTPCK